MAKKLGKKTDELNSLLISNGFIEDIDGENKLTEKGKKFGGESKKGKFGDYFLWNEDLSI